MSEVLVRFHPTPNPHAGKFVLSRRVVEGEGSRSVMSPEEAAGDPVSEALLGLEGVESLFFAEDFITVTKDPATSWEELIPVVSRSIRDAYG